MILYRLGHYESYDFGLELETALAKALDSLNLSQPQVGTIGQLGNIIFHVSGENVSL